jgi:hypothetical protein
MTTLLQLTPRQLLLERQRLQTNSPLLYNALAQTANDVLRIYITLHYAYHNLSQHTPNFTSNANRLLAALQWIHISTHDPHELSLAILDALHLFTYILKNIHSIYHNGNTLHQTEQTHLLFHTNWSLWIR